MRAAPAAPPLDAAAVAAEFPILRREFEQGPLVYLDSAATSQKPEAVLRAMDSAYREHHASIHRGTYALGAESTELFEGARARVARWIGADAKETIFTPNATGAINLAARGLVGPGDRVLVTEMEHHSNIVSWQLAGATLDYVPVDPLTGVADLDAFERLLERGPKVVGVVHVSNVLGTINPIEEIARRAHEAGALVLVDGAQALPHMAVDVRATGADLYAFTAHKMYGPTGIGVLWGRRELLEELPPLIGGGHMISRVEWEASRWNELPWKFEAGTSAIVEAIGLGAAVDWLASVGIDSVRAHEAELVAYAMERLAEVPGLRIYGPPAPEGRGALVSFALEGAHPHDVSEVLGRRNVCVRAGHHCAQPLMRCLGVPATTRASFGVHNTRADVDALVAGLHEVREVLRLDG